MHRGRTSRVVVYPSGVKEVTRDLSKEELIKRLKALTKFFQEMEQEAEAKEQYEPLALHLATDFFLQHISREVRLFVACCLVDIFRVFAPEAPFKTANQLKEIFQFLTKQLTGLEDAEGTYWRRYFYLLENLAMVKSYNICMELEDSHLVFIELFKAFFNVVNDSNSSRVRNFMLDIMCPLITENDGVSPDLLDEILVNLIEPRRTSRVHAYQLTKELLKRTSGAIEPSIQNLFNSILLMGKTSTSEVSGHIYELIYELYMTSSSLLLSVLPQLELKVKSSDERERLSVIKLLSRMFADKDSDLVVQNKQLWHCFIGRFNDISVNIRIECIKFARTFIINHPALAGDVIDCLKNRIHDVDDNVRQEVVAAIVAIAKKDISCVSQELLDHVRERLLDKKWKIRKEAMLGLSGIHKKWWDSSDTSQPDLEKISWIKNKILHMYYQKNLDDLLQVERIFISSLVPYTKEPKERMNILFETIATVDQHAIKAINELLKNQGMLRNLVRDLLPLYHEGGSTTAEEKSKLINSKLQAISYYLPEPSKALDHLKRFSELMKTDQHIHKNVDYLVSHGCSCKKALGSVKVIMPKVGNPHQASPLYDTIKTLMERITPLLFDEESVAQLLQIMADYVDGVGKPLRESTDETPLTRGINFLLTLAAFYPATFKTDLGYEKILSFLKNEDELVSDVAMKILTFAGESIQKTHPSILQTILPILQSKAKCGTPKQAKQAIRCINKIADNKQEVFEQLFQSLNKEKNLILDSENLQTALAALGHLAVTSPPQFASQMKNVVVNLVVKEILMKSHPDQNPSKVRDTKLLWASDEYVSEETQTKIQAIKMLGRWLVGLSTLKSQPNMLQVVHSSGTSTIKLLVTVIQNGGDLMESGKISNADKSRLRLAAGCSLLKIATEKAYSSLITQQQFHTLALLVVDECGDVKSHFLLKLHRLLIYLKLSLQYLALFAFGAIEASKDLKNMVQQWLLKNISKRRESLKQQPAIAEMQAALLPENVIPYVIHMLAHYSKLKNNKDVKHLKEIKECLQFTLDALMTNNGNISENLCYMNTLARTIKQSKDAVKPTDEIVNKKLYAVCDLFLNILKIKAGIMGLKVQSVKPALPSLLFTMFDEKNENTENYLPPELRHVEITLKPKKLAIEKVPESSKGSVKAAGVAGSKPSATKPTESGKLTKPRKYKKASSKSVEDSEDESEDEEDIEEVPTKKSGQSRKTTSSAKTAAVKPSPRTAGTRTSGRIRTIRKFSSDEDEEEEDEMEEVVEEKPAEVVVKRKRGRPPKTSTPQKSSTPRKGAAAAALKSPVASTTKPSLSRKRTASTPTKSVSSPRSRVGISPHKGNSRQTAKTSVPTPSKRARRGVATTSPSSDLDTVSSSRNLLSDLGSYWSSPASSLTRSPRSSSLTTSPSPAKHQKQSPRKNTRKAASITVNGKNEDDSSSDPVEKKGKKNATQLVKAIAKSVSESSQDSPSASKIRRPIRKRRT